MRHIEKVAAPVEKALIILAAEIVVFTFFWLGMVSMASAVEFVSPPGQDVEQQEQRLKGEITNLAKSMVGGDLVEVIVHIGYARTGTASQGKYRVKLPGFNSFIDPSGDGTEQVVPEFVRLRQVFVLVSKNLAPNVKALEQDIITQGNFDRKKGDWVRVVPVEKKGAGLGEESGSTASGKARKKKRPRRTSAPSVNEPESTVHLLKARDSYFKGDYDRSLREILKAIAIEPNSAQAYSMLGSLYYTINWKNLALKYWEIALELEPENKEVEDLVIQLQNSKS